jgi:hypothetical protein
MTGKLSPEREVIATYGAATFQEISMQAAIDRVMHTYGMIENLSPKEKRLARQKVTSYLAEKPDASEHALAVEGLLYLRSVRDMRIKD